MNNRIIFINNSEEKDVSRELAKFDSLESSLSITSDDNLYIGTRLPFNHFFIEIENGNTELTKPDFTIETWDGDRWRQCFDIIDGTNGLSESGHIEFTPDKEWQWWRYDTNYSNSVIEGLKNFKIYDKYWLKISFSENLSEDIKIKYIGNKFSDDVDLKLEYPDLLRTSVLEAFEANKINWNDQHFRAAEIVIKDLIDMGVIEEKGQILNWRDYTDAAIHKVAEIAFISFGSSYTDNSVAARREYQDRISKRIHRVDRNKNAIEDIEESFNVTGFMSR